MMSFGSSVRFEATRAEDGRPKIFWEEARDNVRQKKKQNYKKKDQKYPLRSKAQRDVEEQKQAEPKPILKEAGSKDAPKMKRAPGARPTASKRAPVVEAEPVLSLTEAQLAKMIETIGKVSKEHPLRISIDQETHQITLEQEEDQNKENQSEDGGEKKRSKRKKKTSEKLNKESSSVSSKSGATKRTTTEDGADGGDGGVGSTENDDDKTGVDDAEPKPDTESTPVAETTRGSQALRHLSLSEKKRLQWEVERADEIRTYNPWGRPGAGAPITTSDGDVLADYNSRKPQVIHEQILLVSPRSEAPHSPRKDAGQEDRAVEQQQTTTTGAEMSGATLPDVPHAMRSSFAIGGSGPDENRYQTKRELEKKKWLHELEQQIQDKKIKKQPSTTKDQSPHQTTQQQQAYAQPVQPTTAHAQPVPFTDTHAPDQRVDVLTEVRLSLAQPDLQNKVMVPTFVRGANAMLDPQTLKEMEDKRKRQIEHQRAIQAQVEEKQRLKREAEQKKQEEDLREEKRLQAERDRLTSQFEQEQVKQKRKQEEQTTRVERLKEAMDEAEFIAKQEKHQRRMQHLQQHGHDTTLYHKSFEAQNTPRYAGASAMAATTTVLHVNDAVEPTHVPGLDLSARSHGYHDNRGQERGGHHGNQAIGGGRYGDEGYVENRTLTPSKNRRHTVTSDPEFYSDRKEFGTQTGTDGFDQRSHGPPVYDVTDVKKPRESSAGIEFNKDKLLDIKRSERVKKVRVLSAKSAPSKSKGRNTATSPVKQSHRNKKQSTGQTWNYQNREHKKPVKQSEKDPNYSRNRQESIQRRQQRAQELQAMVMANQDRIPARSRSRSMSPKQHARTRSESPVSQAPRRSRLETHEYNQWARTSDRQATPEPELPVSDRAVPRPRSPPVPAVKHRLYDEPQPGHPDTQGDKRGHYHDHLPTYAPVENGEFIPFMRSSAFLDPSESQRPLPVSREPTNVEQGRKAYAQNQKPGVYGARMNHIHDTGLDTLLPTNGPDRHKHIKKDPITQPNLVKDHPTSRQEAILQQLADIRKNLLLKQREIETCLSPTDLHASRT